MSAGLLHPDPDMFIAASPLQGMPPRGAAYLDSSDELDERCAFEYCSAAAPSRTARVKCLTSGGE